MKQILRTPADPPRSAKRSILILSLIAGVAVSPACDTLRRDTPQEGQFELREDNQGRLIRLDKVTGEMMIVSDGKLLPITPSDEKPPPGVTKTLPPAPTRNQTARTASPTVVTPPPLPATSSIDAPEVVSAVPTSSKPGITAKAGTILTITSPTPFVLTADRTRTPLLVLARGSSVKVVLGSNTEWYRVEYRDPVLGPRVGYIEKTHTSIDHPQAEPVDLSIRDTRPKPMEPVDLSIRDSKPKDIQPMDLSIPELK